MMFKDEDIEKILKAALCDKDNPFVYKTAFNTVSDGTHDVFTKNNELPHNLGSSLFLVKTFFSNLFYIIVLFFYKFFEFRF